MLSRIRRDRVTGHEAGHAVRLIPRRAMLKTTERRRSLSAEDFESGYLFAKTPVVIEGLAQGWPAYSRWDSAYLRARFGRILVPVRDYAVRPYAKLRMPLSEYLDYWDALPEDGRGEKNLYLAEWNFTRDAAELAEDFTVPPQFSKDWIDRLPANLQFGRVWIFMGHPGVFTPIHTDTFQTSAWLTMIRGQKRVRLIAPQDAKFVRKGMDLLDSRTLAELAREGVEVREAVIGRGDTLFIPGGWLHQVNNDTKNFMLTANFADDAHALEFMAEFGAKLMEPIRTLEGLRDAFTQRLVAEGASASRLCTRGYIDGELRRLERLEEGIGAERSRLAALRDIL